MAQNNLAPQMMTFGNQAPAPHPNFNGGIPVGGPKLGSSRIPGSMSASDPMDVQGLSPSESGMNEGVSYGTIDTGRGNYADLTGKSADSQVTGNSFWGEDGFNMGSVATISDTIASFGQLWSGLQQNKLAKDSLNFRKKAYDTNLSNQISSYNLALEDRMTARYHQNNRPQSEADAKINEHKL